MFNTTTRCHSLLLIFFCLTVFSGHSAFAVPVPVVTAPDMPLERFVGEQFCFTAPFENTGTTGYGPYYQVFLKPDFVLASAELFGASVATTFVGVLPSVSADPISGGPVSGPAGSSFYILEPPVGSVTSGGPPLNTNICIDLAPEATPNVLQNSAIKITPGFALGDSPTGVIAIVGNTVDNALTPTIITYSERDITPEGETPPGPVFTYDIEAVSDIASDRTVAPINFPRIELTDNRQFVGPIKGLGGASCVVTVTNVDGVSQSGSLPFTPTNMTTPGGYIDVVCGSGSGTLGSSRDVVITIPVYAVDNLDINSCSYEDNITRNTSKHMVVRKTANVGIVRPSNVVTYTLDFAVSEYAGTENVTITDVLPDGLTYNGVSSLSIDGSAVPISPMVANNAPSGGQTKVTYDVSSAYGALFSPTSSGVITYTATVDEAYDNGDPIRSNDRITNDALIEYSVVGGAGAAPSFCKDTSSATLNVVPLTIEKTILSTQTEFYPGETIKFRLRVNIPSGDTQNISFSDFLPLPALPVGAFSTNTNLALNTNISLGPNDTLGLTPIAITTNTTSNSFSIIWPDVNSVAPEVIEIEVDAVAVSTDPFSDNLFLTNIFELKTTNTHGDSIDQYDAVSFLVRSPDVSVVKGVSPMANVGVGDTINYTIDLTNEGGGIAYDVIVRDVLPIGLSSCVVSSQPAGSGDLFSTLGYALSTTIPVNGTAAFVYSCMIDRNIQIGGSHINTAYVSFTAAIGAKSFPEREGTAVFSMSQPTPSKRIVSTNKSHTSDGTTDTNGSPRPVSIGEIIRYRLSTQIPEGTAGNVRMNDYLPTGQQYVMGSARVALVSAIGMSANFACITGSGLNVIGNSSAVVPTCGVDANGTSFPSGENPVFDLGNVVNNDSDADDEYIVLEFDAIVLNSDVINQQEKKANNRFRARFSGTYFAYSKRVYTQVLEAQITVVPMVSLAAANTVGFSLDVSNTGQATAFQVMGEAGANWSFTLPSDLQSISNIAVNITGDVFENGTTTLLTVTDFSISGVNNEIITLLKPLQLDPGAQFTLSFEAVVIPGSGSDSAPVSAIFEYASQSVGSESEEVRTGSDLSAGTGNFPISDMSVVNDYRTESLIEMFSVSGAVYVDTNSDTNLTLGELGVSGVTVVLHDTANNTCQSIKTDASGEYRFFPVPSGRYQIIQSAQESVPAPSQCPPQPLDPRGYSSTSPNTLSIIVTNNNVEDQDFGELSGPMFSPDHSSQVLPGNAVFYAHVFSTPAEGTVAFSSSLGSQSKPGWTHFIYRDNNCDGVLNGSEGSAPISGFSLGVNSGGQICIINKVFAASNVSVQDQHQVITNAEFTYLGGGLGVENLEVTDLTTTGSSSFVLRKTVENVTQGTAETETQNQASPGDELMYRIYYRNNGSSSINDLKVDDTVPLYTQFVAGSESCGVTLTSLICIPTVNVDGLRWDFMGELAGGENGYVSFKVMVDN